MKNIDKIIEEKLREVFKIENIKFDKSRFTGGLTNYNYIMNIKDKEYVIREPGGKTDEIIDRKIEKINNSIASTIGINSNCIYFDDIYGIKISEYIKASDNIANLNPNSQSNINKVCNIIKKLHLSNAEFPNQFDFFNELRKYEEILENMGGVLFFDYDSWKVRLNKIMEDNVKNIILAPAHNDTVPENFILEETGQIYLIDWEYSGMNDIRWDLAAYILESQLTKEAIDFFLEDYYQKEDIPREDMLKIKAFILAQDLLWTVWALIRHYNGDDFLDYCNNRYERFKKNIIQIEKDIDFPIEDMVV